MNFKPTLIKCIIIMVVFIILLIVNKATSCFGGQLSCEPPQYYCACLKSLNLEYNSSELTEDIIQQKCTSKYPYNQDKLSTIEDCQNMKCKQLPCGGIGGFPVIISGTLLFYVVYSLIQRKRESLNKIK